MKRREKRAKVKRCGKCHAELPGLLFGILAGNKVTIMCRKCGEKNEVKFY